MSALIEYRSYYNATADEFLEVSPTSVLGQLANSHSFELNQNQRDAWRAEIDHLREVASTLNNSHIFIEFFIPRMGKRADVIIISNGLIFVLEYKVGSETYGSHAKDQVLDYALDLKNFHQGSHDKTIIPIVVSTKAVSEELQLQAWQDQVYKPITCNSENLVEYITSIISKITAEPFDALKWAQSSYKPTPTIVEAAQALYRGHNVKEISRSEAGADNLSRTADYIFSAIEQAKHHRKKIICFVTGVPGSGKTLAGLNIANERQHAHESEHAVFLSGNGPLVEVLREALARDDVYKSKLSNNVISKKDALRKAGNFIQNIHHFRDEYITDQSAPIEKVVIFDEAQRAWTKDQASKFMKARKGLEDFDMSEPAFLLSVMDRHQDWCAIVCLIGGGQEINTGEAGLGEWLSAVIEHHSDWDVHISDRLSDADFLMNTSGNSNSPEVNVFPTPSLNLSVSIRSFRAEALSNFVGEIINGDAKAATELKRQLEDYPLAITRDINVVRNWLREKARGTERTGLVASSNAIRLKPHGIHVKSDIDPANWFLGGKDDVRSSYALEDAATEFDVQGLELDWVGVCWDANFRRKENTWAHLNFRGTQWQQIRDNTRQTYLENAYRVLLTRARQGMIIYVPYGCNIDNTRLAEFYDPTFKFLMECGIKL